jgi:hypothetical protein
MSLSQAKSTEKVIQKVEDDMVVYTVKVREKVKEIVVHKIKEEELIVPNPIKEDFPYKVPVAEVFEYPEPKPYDYPVPIPKVNPDEIKKNTEDCINNAIRKIDFNKIFRDILPAERFKKETDGLTEVIKSVVKEALSKLDMKAMVKEALGEIDMPIPKVVEGDTIVVPKIEKGRTVIEYTIIPREEVVTLKGVRIVDEDNNLINEVKSEMK